MMHETSNQFYKNYAIRIVRICKLILFYSKINSLISVNKLWMS